MSKAGWIKVEDALPEVPNMDCWVWSEDWGSDASPVIDWWCSNRGEKYSGWYATALDRITHWMPAQVPEPPEADDVEGATEYVERVIRESVFGLHPKE